MKELDFHSLFYYCLVSPLQGLVGGDGSYFESRYPRTGNEPVFKICWERRPNFEYQYQREKFLAERPRMVVSGGANLPTESYVMLLKESNGGKNVTLYKRAVAHLFGKRSEEALNELKELLDKFYTVTVEERSNDEEVDFSNDRHEARYRIQRV